MTTCTECNGENTVYQVYSAGKEFYCPDCDYTGEYAEGDKPPRVKMIADNRFDELREEMRKHFEGRYPKI